MDSTSEQNTIIEAAKNERAMVIGARAGTGKTSLGVKMTQVHNKKRWQFIVFNVKNAEELKQRLPANANGSTSHSFCNRYMTGRPRLDKTGNKLFKLIFAHESYNFKQNSLSKEEQMKVREDFNEVKSLVSLLKNSFVKPNEQDVINIITHYGLTFNVPLEQVCSDAIEFLDESDKDESVIDFDDMVRFPIIRNSITPSFDYFFLDEAQDNTPIRNELLRQMKEKGCQVIAVGDEFQAIYGFAGADSDSMNKIQEAISPIVLPMTINFRCGKNIITKAQTIVPDIKAFDGSIDGEVHYTNPEEFEKLFQPGDVALSRFNKVIIPICFKLIKQGKKATIQGRDFGSMLKGMVTGFQATTIDEFYKQIDKWQERQLAHSKNESSTAAITDRYECLKFFADNSDTVEQIVERIDAIFVKDSSDGYKLSTVHRAKGMEFSRVFILDSNNFMKTHPKMMPWEQRQLQNLMYVAITRAKEKLYFVSERINK